MQRQIVAGRAPSRRGFLAGGLAASVARGAGARPNILYIMTDQQHAGMMSATGNRRLKTPAMDSLAARGVRFELAYASNPVCMPARVSMMTGRYPSHFGMRTNEQAQIPEAAQGNALGHLFRKAGYRTVFGGKTHWPRMMTAESIGFEYLTADEREVLAGECAGFLRGRPAEPFLLVASFINPHDICYMAIDAYTAANGLPQMYPKSVVERQRLKEALVVPAGARLPEAAANSGPTANEPAALGQYGSFRGWARKNWGIDEWRRHRWAYARLTERVDAEIGQVLGALRESGLDRNTVVVFSSDHGDMDSAHGFEHKSLPYEESARVPFIVCPPGGMKPRVDARRLVCSSVDLLPTLCDYAGIAAPEGLPGRSVRPPVERGAAEGWREEVVIECDNSRTLRGGRYKYSIFAGGEPREMLIDLRRDPGEMVNLAVESRFRDVVAEHRERLRREMAGRGDEIGLSLMGR